MSDLLTAGLFVKLSFDIGQSGSQGSRRRPRRVSSLDAADPGTAKTAILLPFFFNRFFDSVVDRFLIHCPHQPGTKNRPKLINIDAKMSSILDSILKSTFGRVLLPTFTPESQPSSRLAFSWFLAYNIDINFGSHFVINLAPFWYPKNTKIHRKTDSKRHQKNDRFLNGLFGHHGSILTPKLGPCWPLFRLKRGDAVRSSPLV